MTHHEVKYQRSKKVPKRKLRAKELNQISGGGTAEKIAHNTNPAATAMLGSSVLIRGAVRKPSSES